ncbi:MAG TPA: radical SAM protein [Thermotogota bacterium]|nr:radical SAM protein [Thermotogota bacterium]
MVFETTVKKAINQSGIPVARFAANPYIGCTMGCRYCFARFIGAFKYTNGQWGRDVWVRTNFVQKLQQELARPKWGTFFLSTACDPYQPIERKYRLSRGILTQLYRNRLPVFLMTKSTLVREDVPLLKKMDNLTMNITITTDSEDVRKVLEPGAPPIEKRIELVKELNENGLDVGVFVGPVLPMDPWKLAKLLRPVTPRVHLDPLNYPQQVQGVFRKNGWDKWLEREAFENVREVFGEFFPLDKEG